MTIAEHYYVVKYPCDVFSVVLYVAEMAFAEDDCPPVVFKLHGAECEHTCGYVAPENAFDKVVI